MSGGQSIRQYPLAIRCHDITNAESRDLDPTSLHTSTSQQERLQVDRVAETQAALASIFDRHTHAALAFSGGKDSLALLHLCRPYRDRLTALWVNTGAMFPHMVEFVRRTVGWNFVELTSDLVDYWRQAGMPTSVMATDHVLGGRGEPLEPRMNGWTVCCAMLRMQPMRAWLASNPDVTVFLHGQRNSDAGRFRAEQILGGVRAEVVAPLWSWSDEDVSTYVDQHGIELPEQYSMGWHGSGECAPCTAKLTPARLAYMRKRYPELAALTEQRVRLIYETAIAAAQPELAAVQP